MITRYKKVNSVENTLDKLSIEKINSISGERWTSWPCMQLLCGWACSHHIGDNPAQLMDSARPEPRITFVLRNRKLEGTHIVISMRSINQYRIDGYCTFGVLGLISL